MTRPVHFELDVVDPERSVAFFTEALGWRFTRWGDQAYWLAATGDADTPGIDGAVLASRDGQPRR